MNKKAMAVTSIVLIALGIFFLWVMLAGGLVGIGVNIIFSKIPWWGWIILIILILKILGGNKKK